MYLCFIYCPLLQDLKQQSSVFLCVRTNKVICTQICVSLCMCIPVCVCLCVFIRVYVYVFVCVSVSDVWVLLCFIFLKSFPFFGKNMTLKSHELRVCLLEFRAWSSELRTQEPLAAWHDSGQWVALGYGNSSNHLGSPGSGADLEVDSVVLPVLKTQIWP